MKRLDVLLKHYDKRTQVARLDIVDVFENNYWIYLRKSLQITNAMSRPGVSNMRPATLCATYLLFQS